jgi:hypothetical protein
MAVALSSSTSKSLFMIVSPFGEAPDATLPFKVQGARRAGQDPVAGGLAHQEE